jgi:ATP-dependent DNA helicase RecG
VSKSIPDLIKTGESETVEFKEKFDERCIETLVSFANTRGGVIFIGVSDKNNIKGINIGKETINQWVNQISLSTEPRLIPDIEKMEIDGKTVIAVQIKEYPIKPVSTKGRCFKRVDSSNRTMTTQEITQMYLHSTGLSWDKYPAQNANLEDVDIERVKRYIQKAKETGRKKIAEDEDLVQVLEKMNLITKGQPTWAAVLLFCKEPQKIISQAAIHCGRFKEGNIVIDDRMITGTLFEQIDEGMDFIHKNINVEFVMTGRPERDQIWDYPLEALREALINAVCHRDYTILSHIEIRIYEDRLVIWSPGHLPFGITLEELYKPHSSTLRNKGLAEVFYDTELIEQWGSGIDKIQKYCLNAGLPEPIFEEYQGFQVVFRKDIYNEDYLRSLNLNERQIKAVMYVKKKGKITNKEYQEICSISKRTASRDMAEMVLSGLFEQIGTTGTGTAYVLRGQRRHNGAIMGPKVPK